MRTVQSKPAAVSIPEPIVVADAAEVVAGAEPAPAVEYDRRSGDRRDADRRGEVERRSGFDRRRGPGRRRTEERKAAEEGHMNEFQLEFLMAMDEYRRVNNRPFPTLTEVLDVLMYLGYRQVAPVGEFKLSKGRQTPARPSRATAD